MSGPRQETLASGSWGEGKEPDKERTRRKRRLTAGKTKTKPHGKCGASREPSRRCVRTARTHIHAVNELQTEQPMSTTRLREQLQGQRAKLRQSGNCKQPTQLQEDSLKVSLLLCRITVSFHHFCLVSFAQTCICAVAS